VELRDQAWGFFDGYCRRKIRTLTGHQAGVTWVAMEHRRQDAGLGKQRPDDQVNGTPPRANSAPTLKGHSGGVLGYRGAWTARRWRRRAAIRQSSSGTRTPARNAPRLKGHSDAVYSLAWSPDSKTLASASSDKTIKLWDAGSDRERTTLTSFRADTFWRCATPGTRNLFLERAVISRNFPGVADGDARRSGSALLTGHAQEQEREAASTKAGLQIWHQGSYSGKVEYRFSASVSRRDDSFAFFHRIDAIDSGNRDLFFSAARPMNLHSVHFRCRSETEVQTLVGNSIHSFRR